MVKLGRRNTRMKDFHDLWALSTGFEYDGTVLLASVSACFSRRGTLWSPEPADVLTPDFYRYPALRRTWEAYRSSGAFSDAPPEDFATVGERIMAFLGPIRDHIVADSIFTLHWPPGGPWTNTAPRPSSAEASP